MKRPFDSGAVFSVQRPYDLAERRLQEVAGSGANEADLAHARALLAEKHRDFYREVDVRFFDAITEDLRACVNEYKHLLDHPTLQRVLAGESLAASVPTDLVRALRELVKKEVQHSAMLAKHPELYNADFLFRAAGVEPPAGDQRYIAGRVLAHLARMLTPHIYYPDYQMHFPTAHDVQPITQHQQAFARAFVRYVSAQQGDTYNDARHMHKIIGLEGYHVQAFWTIAPYLFDVLREEICEEDDEAMHIIFTWIRSSHVRAREPELLFLEDDTYDFGCLWRKIREPFILGLDERLPSHLLARLLALDLSDKIKADAYLEQPRMRY